MSTFYSGAGSKLAAGLQLGTNGYFNNTSTSINTLLNITSATFDPSVEKISEETLLQSKVKTASLLASITVDGSFDANLKPEMTDWVFSAAMQQIGTTPADTTPPQGYSLKQYTLKDAGNDPLGSTLVLAKGDQVTTYPAMTVRSMTMTMPNNDFVTVSMDLTGREEIKAGGSSAIDPLTSVPSSEYEDKSIPSNLAFTKSSYIVTNGVFEWQRDPEDEETIETWCIESSTLTIDNGIEDSPRCYQDGKYANIPVMGIRSVTFDFNTPYNSRIEEIKENYLLTSLYGRAKVEFTNADDENEKITVVIPHLSITSVGAGVSGTGVIDASVSGEAIQQYVAGDDEASEPVVIYVQTKN